jgi:hypothetical protein
MAQNLYNPNTGALLKPGETVYNANTGEKITQGTEFNAGGNSNANLPAPVHYNANSTTAEYGNKNQAVYDLQKKLNDLGANLKLDSMYGPLTREAYNRYMGGNQSDLHNIINGNQTSDVQNYNDANGPQERGSVSTYTDAFGNLKETLMGTNPPPTAPNFENTYQSLRDQYGLSALETNLGNLNTEEAKVRTAKENSVNAEMDKPVAMNVIGGRVSEQERNFNTRLNSIALQKTAIANQITNANNAIDTVMKYKTLDYTTAKDEYDKQFSQNLEMFNATSGIIDKEADVARANAQIMLNAYQDAGKTWATLTPSDQSNLIKLGTQSGLGSDFFKDVLATSAGKSILTTIVSADKTGATIVYKDGTTKFVATGLHPGSGSNTGGGTDGGYVYTGDDIASGTSFLNEGGTLADGTVFNGRGTDGYVDPGAYVLLYNNWIKQNGTPQGFLKKFPLKNVNPVSYPSLPLALQPSSSQGS